MDNPYLDFNDLHKDVIGLVNGLCLQTDDTLKFGKETAGGGAVVHNGIDRYNLTAASVGDKAAVYLKQIAQYFPAKATIYNFTFQNMHPQAGYRKKIGYFDNYNGYDGISLESVDGSVFWVHERAGVELARHEIATRNDWRYFGYFAGCFYYLGGFTSQGFLAERDNSLNGLVQKLPFYTHVGKEGTFMERPQKSIRYEIECISTPSEQGVLTYFCSNLASKAGAHETSIITSHSSGGNINTNNAGTWYLLGGLKKKEGFENIPVQIVNISSSQPSSGSDNGELVLVVNPVLQSGVPLTFITREKTSPFVEFIANAHLGQVVLDDAWDRQGQSYMVSNQTMLDSLLLENVLKMLTSASGANDVLAILYRPATSQRFGLGEWRAFLAQIFAKPQMFILYSNLQNQLVKPAFRQAIVRRYFNFNIFTNGKKSIIRDCYDWCNACVKSAFY